jgi:hypothetical protein
LIRVGSEESGQYKDRVRSRRLEWIVSVYLRVMKGSRVWRLAVFSLDPFRSLVDIRAKWMRFWQKRD